jgi:hypothetical protein
MAWPLSYKAHYPFSAKLLHREPESDGPVVWTNKPFLSTRGMVFIQQYLTLMTFYVELLALAIINNYCILGIYTVIRKKKQRHCHLLG